MTEEGMTDQPRSDQYPPVTERETDVSALKIKLTAAIAATVILLGGAYYMGRLSIRVDQGEEHDQSQDLIIQGHDDEISANREAGIQRTEAMKSQAQSLSQLADAVRDLRQSMERNRQ